MLPIHTILHPTDFSVPSDYAFRTACALARDYGARLVALHVVTIPTVVYGEGMVLPDVSNYHEEARAKLDRLEAPANVRLERRAVEGEPVTEILRGAEAARADMIVMGTHGRTGLSRLLMGSVAEKVVRQAACPVLTVRMPLAEAVPAEDTPAVEPNPA
jgi:nucleotide-binding universal stress UspA family protein